MNTDAIITSVFEEFSEVRYLALYLDDTLTSRQRGDVSDSSSGESDKYEELFVNPALLTLANQRGNLDCGGLNYIVVRYGNFYQVIKSVSKGHISICLELGADVNIIPQNIFRYLKTQYAGLY